MTSRDDRIRRDDLLSGRARSEQGRHMVDEARAVDGAAKALLGGLMRSGGVSDPPPRDAVESVLGMVAPSASSLPPIDIAAAGAANAAYVASAMKGEAPPANPIARRIADQVGIHLGAVPGTGDGPYAITVEDVRAVVSQRDSERLVTSSLKALVAADIRTASLITRASEFMPSQMVAVDEYGTNPLWEDIAQTNLEKAKAIVAAGDKPPTLFESGDAPVFLASGIQPTAVAAVPWPVRHVIARLAAADAAQLLNKFTPGPTSVQRWRRRR